MYVFRTLVCSPMALLYATQFITSILTNCAQKPLKTSTLANSEDPGEMPHNAAFHQGLHCLLRLIDLQKKKYNIFWKF